MPKQEFSRSNSNRKEMCFLFFGIFMRNKLNVFKYLMCLHAFEYAVISYSYVEYVFTNRRLFKYV